MADERVTAKDPVLVIEDADGDGKVLSFVPPPLNHLMRGLVNRSGGQRSLRLMRVAEKIYTALQEIEDRALPPDQQRIKGTPFLKALHDDEKIERALRLFSSSWRSGLIELRGHDGKAISQEKARTTAFACGMTIEQAQVHFIDIAVSSIFKKNPKARSRLVGTIHSPDDLPKVRVLSQFQPLALTELVMGLGRQTGGILAEMAPEQLYALATLKSYHLRAMRAVFGAGFRNIFQWNPDVIRGVATSFQCVEQIRDLGDALGMIQDPEALAALGRWEIRDVTDQVNQERAKSGRGKLRGRRFETDIGIARRILGDHFNTMMEKPPDILQAFGAFILSIRDLELVERQERIDEVRQFCDRYLEYMNSDAMKALGLSGSDPSSYGEAFYILEGLFSKQGLGRKFFEGPLQTPEGAKAIVGLKKDIDDMRARGSLKGEAEIAQFLSNSDILDRHISKFLGAK